MFTTQFSQERNGSSILQVDQSLEAATRQWLLSQFVEIDLEYPSAFPQGTHCFSFHNVPASVVERIQKHLGYDVDAEYEAALEDRYAHYGY